MADSSRPSSRISRRAAIGGLGAGLASIPLLWWLDVPDRVSRAIRPAPGDPPTAGYVDRDGWMLTPEDVPAFEARPTTPQ